MYGRIIISQKQQHRVIFQQKSRDLVLHRGAPHCTRVHQSLGGGRSDVVSQHTDRQDFESVADRVSSFEGLPKNPLPRGRRKYLNLDSWNCR